MSIDATCRRLACLLGACLLAAVPTLSSGAQQIDRSSAWERHQLRRADVGTASRRAAAIAVHGPGPAPLEPRALRGGPAPEPGDLVTTAGSLSRALRVVLKNRRGRLVRQTLSEEFVSRGIDHDPSSGLVAVAAVDRVLLYDPRTADVTVLTEMGSGETLQFANDVLFDEDGLLIIADMGAVSSGKDPADGRIWEYDPLTGEVQRLGARRNLSNPSLLAADSKGRVLFVDSEAGRYVSPLLDIRWDMVLRLRGARRKAAKRIFKGEGLQATAFDIGPDDRMWFGNVSEIAILDGKELRLPCPLAELPFEFITGLAVLETDDARAADGADVITRKRKIFDVDDECSSRVRFKGPKLNATRGLARVLDVPAE